MSGETRVLGTHRMTTEGDVVHLIADRLVDLTPMLGSLETRSRDFH